MVGSLPPSADCLGALGGLEHNLNHGHTQCEPVARTHTWRDSCGKLPTTSMATVMPTRHHVLCWTVWATVSLCLLNEKGRGRKILPAGPFFMAWWNIPPVKRPPLTTTELIQVALVTSSKQSKETTELIQVALVTSSKQSKEKKPPDEGKRGWNSNGNRDQHKV